MTYEQPQGDDAKPTLVTGFELRGAVGRVGSLDGDG